MWLINMEAIITFEQKLGSQFLLPSCSNSVPVRKFSSFPLTSAFSSKPRKKNLLKATATSPSDSHASNRTFKKLPPSQWTHRFLSVPVDVLEMEVLKKEMEILKPKVRGMLMCSHGLEERKNIILLIYLLMSLGLAWHFEDEIKRNLEHSFEIIADMMRNEYDLYRVSIIFFVLRTYGHNISSDVFKRLQEDNGKFKECLKDDPKGILALYEASHLGTTTDFIMDEALSFAKSHLESLSASETCSSHFSKSIQNALCLPQHYNMEIIVAMEYIPIYEQEDDHDEMLLKFSKLNFNFLQLHYLQELKILSKWYKDLDFESRLPPYFRDRIVELHFYVLAKYFEPQFSRARIMLTKFYKILLILDDTCDRYGSLPEVESLTNVLERWAPDDPKAMCNLPNYMQVVCKFIFDTFEELEREVGPEGRFFSVKETIDEFKIFVRSNHSFAKWSQTAIIPTFEGYMDVGCVEVAVYAGLACAWIYMGEVANEEVYVWLKSRPKLIRFAARKARLMNDITGFEEDMRRGNFMNAVKCYMNQYGVSEDEAITELGKMVVDANKIINEELLNTVDVPHRLLKTVMDCLRTTNVAYNVVEGLTNPEGKIWKYFIPSLFVNRFSL